MPVRLPITGGEDTGSNRLWNEEDMDAVVIDQQFHTHYPQFNVPYSSPPDVITALRYIDIGPGDNTIGIRGSAKRVGGNNFTLWIELWGDGIMCDNGCTWLAVTPGDRRYRSGEYRINKQPLSTDLPVKFDPEFPVGTDVKVVAWLSGFQMAVGDDWDLSVIAEEPTPDGFKLTALARHAALLEATISWFAYDTTDRHIQSGSFESTESVPSGRTFTDRVFEKGQASFSPHFTSIPRVIHGISSLHVASGGVMSLELNKELVATREGFPWSMGSWGSTRCQQLGATYVAICDTV